MSTTGYNPLRWRCSERGCFNEKKRPKIEEFADCLPGKNAFGDVDAITEINGRFLLLEFKGGEPRDLPTGQRILIERLTRLSGLIWVVIVCGDAETMAVEHLRVVRLGRFGPWEKANLDDLRNRIKLWSSRAASMPRLKAVAA